MKTKIISIIIACLILFNCIPAYASTNVMVGDDTVEEISVFADDLVSDINSTLLPQNISIQKEDIDYSKAMKFYSGTGLFLDDKLEKESIISIIEERNYYYLLPIFCGEKTIMVTYSKGKAPTDEQKEKLPEDVLQEIEQNVGKWIATSIELYDKTVDYKANTEKVLKDNNIENAKVYFVIGTSENLGYMAVICREDTQDIQFNVLDKCYANEDDLNSYKTFLDNEVLYSYEEVKAIADKDYEELQKHPDSYGSGGGLATANSSKIIIISAVSAVAIVIIAVTSVIIIKKRRKNNSGEQI